MNIKEALTSAYDDLSPYSDSKRWEFFNNLRSLEFFTSHISSGVSVLDIGSGIGIFALALSKLGYNVVGLDKYIFQPDNYLSMEKMGIDGLQKIWQKNNLSIINADIFDFSSDKKFDCVMNIAVLEHQKSPKKFIELCLKHLKPNGYFFCVVPNMVDLLNRFRFLFGRSACRDLRPFFEAGENFVGHWREYTIKEMIQMAEWSGLDTVEAKNYRTSPLFNGKDRFPRNILLATFRLLADLIPGARETNSMLARKTAEK